MATTFTDPPKDFSAPDAGASRYIKQLAALEQRAESERKTTNGWRLTTLAMSGIAALATGGLLHVASSTPPPALHLVEIDARPGSPCGTR